MGPSLISCSMAKALASAQTPSSGRTMPDAQERQRRPGRAWSPLQASNKRVLGGPAGDNIASHATARTHAGNPAHRKASTADLATSVTSTRSPPSTAETGVSIVTRPNGANAGESLPGYCGAAGVRRDLPRPDPYGLQAIVGDSTDVTDDEIIESRAVRSE